MKVQKFVYCNLYEESFLFVTFVYLFFMFHSRRAEFSNHIHSHCPNYESIETLSATFNLFWKSKTTKIERFFFLKLFFEIYCTMKQYSVPKFSNIFLEKNFKIESFFKERPINCAPHQLDSDFCLLRINGRMVVYRLRPTVLFCILFRGKMFLFCFAFF